MDTITSSLIKAYMQYGQERSETLIRNIANSNTPKYTAQDIAKPGSFAQLLSTTGSAQVTMSATSIMHFQSSKTIGKFKATKDRNAGPTKMNGNNVDLPSQTMKLEETRQDYAAAAKAYATLNSSWATVMGKK